MANKFAGHEQWPRASLYVCIYVCMLRSNELDENGAGDAGMEKGRRLYIQMVLGLKLMKSIFKFSCHIGIQNAKFQFEAKDVCIPGL